MKLFTKLHLMQTRVSASCLQKLFMGTTFNDMALIQYEDFIGLLDGGEAVGDGNHRAVFHYII